MTCDSTDRDSIRSLSPIIIDDHQLRNSFSLLSCWGCSRTGKNNNGEKGFFKRMQSFKAQKRQSSVRKQQSVAAVSNGHLASETDRLLDEPGFDITSPELIKSSPHLRRNCQSISKPIRHKNNSIDAYSLTDIEIGSLVNGRKLHNPNATPKSIVSHNFSLATTNLSAYSTQSLLRKLLDKAQILDEYYKDLSHKPPNHSSSSLSSSSNSLLGKSDATPHSFLYRHQSNDSIRKSQRRKFRNLYDNISSDSSRFNLYADEDNILRELIRFNNDIDLILSRLETDGEVVQPSLDENLIEQTTIESPPQVHNDQ